MKKKKIKSLKLNKKTISALKENRVVGNNIKGGTLGLLCIIYSAIECTKGDCDLPTIGTGDGPYCLSQDADAWCGGRA